MRRFIVAAVMAVALVIPASVVAEGPADVPGFGSVSPAVQSYWLDKLAGDFSNVGNPDPATVRAQWLYVQKQGLVGSALTANDLAIGLAWSAAYAAQAGVTAAQLDAAGALIVEKGGIEGITGYDRVVARAYLLAHPWPLGVPAPSNAREYIASLVASGNDPEFTAALAGAWGLTLGAPVKARSTSAIARLRTYIARLTVDPIRNAAKLALYQARLDEYLAR